MGSVPVLGLPVCIASPEEIQETARRWLCERCGRMIVTINPEIALLARRNSDLRKGIERAALVVPDGFGVVWAIRRLHRIQLKRQPGIELAANLLRDCAAMGQPAFFIGGKNGVADAAARYWQKQHPSLQVSGTAPGYLAPVEEESLLSRIQSSKPALLLVGMGAGMQERLISRLPLCSFGVAVGIGGAMEVWAGVKRRAPAWMRSASLEWAYRLFAEPRRLGRVCQALPFFGMVWWRSLRRSAS
ncbi:MAG: WecB/TagA/CpsF family glycosyltransferase [Coprothermobacterota bacterium]|nr:WecB/TagA/CpsF family glycosyltransferase [Coprothermobacterota bacterium]